MTPFGLCCRCGALATITECRSSPLSPIIFGRGGCHGAAVTGNEMTATLPNEYVSGGYYLAHLAERAKYMSPELIPDQVLSASSMICDYFPDCPSKIFRLTCNH